MSRLVLLAAGVAMHTLDGFAIDATEVTIGQFRTYAAATGFISTAEKTGGGYVWNGGWRKMPGWSWKTPFGKRAADDEPAVHLTWAEAQAFCRWAGKRLPTDAQWNQAAYTEQRASPPAPLIKGKTYPDPTGDTPAGANYYCDRRCENPWRDLHYDDGFARNAPAGKTHPGVNGLWDMGGNVWERVADARGGERTPRGGSWWYDAEKMQRAHTATKPADFHGVYIGFRCAK